jgi:hypothetical protein
VLILAIGQGGEETLQVSEAFDAVTGYEAGYPMFAEAFAFIGLSPA